MTCEPSDTLVEAAARAIQKAAFEARLLNSYIIYKHTARAALRAAFAAAIEAGEAEPIAEVADPEGKMSIGPLYTLAHNNSPVDGLFLRTQEGEK